MRIVILIALAAVAAILGYFWHRGECPGGQVFETKEQCEAAGIGPAFCAGSFAESRRKATLEYAPFPNQNDCLMQFPRCEPHARVVGGFVPVPRGVCVSRGRAGEPIYERYGQRVK